MVLEYIYIYIYIHTLINCAIRKNYTLSENYFHINAIDWVIYSIVYFINPLLKFVIFKLFYKKKRR